LIHLLCRFHDPETGSVRADGIDLRELDLTSWRARIAFAGQDAELLSGTVRFNIAYGVDEASDEEIEEAARVAQAHEFIVGLPGGYDAEVGPRGTRLVRRSTPADRPRARHPVPTGHPDSRRGDQCGGRRHGNSHPGRHRAPLGDTRWSWSRIA
jgi:hypothetical protein